MPRVIIPFNRTIINLELDIFLKQGKSQELIDKLNVAIQEDPENTVYYFARAISYEGLAGTLQEGTGQECMNVKSGSFENMVKDSLGEPYESVKDESDGKKLVYQARNCSN